MVQWENGFGKVLYADIEAEKRERIIRELSVRGFNIHTVDCAEDGLYEINTGAYDAIVFDYNLFSGKQADFLYSLTFASSVPPLKIIVGENSEEAASFALHILANDWVLKDPYGLYIDRVIRTLEKEKARRDLLIEEKNLRKSLEKSERRFLDMANNAGEWLWEMDTGFRFTYSSPSVERFLGLLPSDILGDKLGYHLSPLSLKDEGFTQLLASGNTVGDMKAGMINRRGDEMVIEMYGTPVMETDGNMAGYRGIFRDITDQVMAERALAATNGMFRAFMKGESLESIFQNAPKMISEHFHFPNVLIKIFDPTKLDERIRELGIGGAIFKNISNAENDQLDREISGFSVVEGDEFVKAASASDDDPDSAPGLSGESGVFASIPILFDKKILGTICIADKRRRRIHHSVMDGVRSVAEYLSYVVDKKRADYLLSKSEQKYRTLMEQSFDGIFVADLQGALVDASPAALKMTGYSIDEARKLTFTDLVRKDDLQKNPLKLKELADGQTIKSERWILRKDGSSFQGEITARMLPEKLILGVVHDITERKAAEEKILSVARFPEENPHPVMRISSSGKLLFANSSSGPLLNKWMSQGCEDVCETVKQMVCKSISTRKNIEMETEAEGEHFALTLKPLPEEGYVNVYGRNITDKKKAEVELYLASKVFESTLDGVMITNSTGNIVSVNPAFTRITGYEADEALGHNPRLLKSDRHGPEFYAEMWRSLLECGFWQGEIWNRRKNGEIYPQWMNITALREDKNPPIQFISVFHDISDRKSMEDEIKYRAHYDPLTGLPNRSLFHDRFEHAISRAKREGKQLAIMYIDLDGFKNVNDTLGHLAGDMLLQGVSARLVSALREEDTVCRVGGDEFVALIERGKSITDFETVAEKIVSSVREPFNYNNTEVNVGASVGIAVYPLSGQNATTLLQNADKAMYHSKSKGKNCYSMFE